MKEKNLALIPAALLLSGGMTLPGSAIFSLFVIIAFVNAGIGLRMRNQINKRLPSIDQIPWWYRGRQIRTLKLHRDLFPESSLRFCWLCSAVGAFVLFGTLIYLGFI